MIVPKMEEPVFSIQLHTKELTMTDFITGGGRGNNILGRKIVVVLPVVLILMIIIFLFMSLPLRYYYKVEQGQLYLKAGKLGWVDETRSKAFEPVSVEGLNLKEIPSQVFESEGEALAALRKHFTQAVEEECLQMVDLESELVKHYKSLLTKYTIAHSAGVVKYAREITVLKGWLDMHAEKMQKMHSMEKVPAYEPPGALEADAIVPEAAQGERSLHP